MKRADPTRLYYALSFGLHLPTWVVMAVYLVKELHLSPLQLVLMGTAMEAAVFLFEVPTGVVADTYSRRLSLIIGYIGMGAAWVAVGLVSAPWVIVALWACWGLAYTFTSGAEQAWIADEVGVENIGTIFLRAARWGQAGAVVGLLLQVAVGTASLRAGVILGGLFTILCGLACIALMPETGFRRRPRAERGSALAEMRTTAVAGARYAWAAPVILLLIGIELFMGASSEAFDRLKEAHFLRDVGLPVVGDLDPVIWFGSFWLAGMILNIASIGSLIRRVERGGRNAVAHFLFGFTAFELAAMLLFALTGSTWLGDRRPARRLLRPQHGGPALRHLAERADHRLECPRDRALAHGPVERDRPGRRRPRTRCGGQRVGDSRLPRRRSRRDRPRAGTLCAGDRAPRP